MLNILPKNHIHYKIIQRALCDQGFDRELALVTSKNNQNYIIDEYGNIIQIFKQC